MHNESLSLLSDKTNMLALLLIELEYDTPRSSLMWLFLLFSWQ